ncbi:hypothetical protein ACS0TY_032594 [Phlomoides rotata]
MEEEDAKHTSSEEETQELEEELCAYDISSDEDKEAPEDVQSTSEEEEEEEDISKFNLPFTLLLNGFQNHVTRFIWQGIEQGELKCHNHVSKFLAWKVKDDANTIQRRSLFKKSKLLMIRRAS